MQIYALVCFVIALLAGLFAFAGPAPGAALVAPMLFRLFGTMAALTWLVGLLSRR